MIVPSSNGVDGRPGCRLRNERGAVTLFVALSLVVTLGVVGIALDFGHAYLARTRISRAVDAGALAAARTLRQGQAAAEAEAEAVAYANRISPDLGEIETNIVFGMNGRGENTVEFTATQRLHTVFLHFLGLPDMVVSAVAEAAVPPLDVVLVLDTSGSLGQEDAWDDLQDAATIFLEYFSDQVDKMALVTFQIVASNRIDLRHGFKVPVRDTIRNLTSVGDTNIQEGLRLAREQIASGATRPRAAKVVVFFTDGRATAVRENFGGYDRLAAVPVRGSGWRGYFDNPASISSASLATPDGCNGSSSCFGISGNSLRAMAADKGLEQAALLRREGAMVYTIGLGNTSYSSGDLRHPDLQYLREVANEDGVVSSEEPQGRMYFAPSAAQLESVFREVANDLIVRLAR